MLLTLIEDIFEIIMLSAFVGFIGALSLYFVS